jgi:acylaminoacyl-peptidase
LGYGQQRVEELVGKCGFLDVEECHASSKYLIEKGWAAEGPGKQLVMGGSHGGFLSALRKSHYSDNVVS